jgi:lysozyme family protein
MIKRFFRWLSNLFKPKPKPIPDKPIAPNAPVGDPIAPESPKTDEPDLDTVDDGTFKKPDFTYLWDNATLREDKLNHIQSVCKRIMDNAGVYKRVSLEGKRMARLYHGIETPYIPWYFIAVLHYRESNMDFRGVLHNGQRILGTGKQTTWVPKGRGPFETWEEAANDALFILKHFHWNKEWDIYKCIERAERYNGLGYRNKGHYSPYLFSGTNHYDGKGKYVADGRYDRNAVEKQLGVVAIWKGLNKFHNVSIK